MAYFDINQALATAQDRAAEMNDPNNFMRRKMAMMQNYEMPKVAQEYMQRQELQKVANQPEMAKIRWEQSPDNQQQWLQRIRTQNEPASIHAAYEYSQTRQDRLEDLARVQNAPQMKMARSNADYNLARRKKIYPMKGGGFTVFDPANNSSVMMDTGNAGGSTNWNNYLNPQAESAPPPSYARPLGTSSSLSPPSYGPAAGMDEVYNPMQNQGRYNAPGYQVSRMPGQYDTAIPRRPQLGEIDWGRYTPNPYEDLIQ
jgi:hypothetical protein